VTFERKTTEHGLNVPLFFPKNTTDPSSLRSEKHYLVFCSI